jgi:hypothetical protein
MIRLVAAALAAILCLAAAPASAREVFLNGIKLDTSVTIAPQTFPNCEVRVADNGDIYITAKGFKLEPRAKGDAPPVTAPAPTTLQGRYWLISKQPRKGMAQYEVDVFVNGKFVKKVRSADDPVILEVTKWVRPGENKVQLVAKKTITDKRLSSSPTDTLDIVLGEGSVNGGTISITRPVVQYKRTAHETQGFTDESGFEGR